MLTDELEDFIDGRQESNAPMGTYRDQLALVGGELPTFQQVLNPGVAEGSEIYR